MTPPSNCPYKNLTAKPCWSCPHHMPDVDECTLNCVASVAVNNTGTALQAATSARSFEDRLRDYEEERRKLLELSKEALVDLIIHRPQMY